MILQATELTRFVAWICAFSARILSQSSYCKMTKQFPKHCLGFCHGGDSDEGSKNTATLHGAWGTVWKSWFVRRQNQWLSFHLNSTPLPYFLDHLSSQKRTQVQVLARSTRPRSIFLPSRCVRNGSAANPPWSVLERPLSLPSLNAASCSRDGNRSNLGCTSEQLKSWRHMQCIEASNARKISECSLYNILLVGRPLSSMKLTPKVP